MDLLRESVHIAERRMGDLACFPAVSLGLDPNQFARFVRTTDTRPSAKFFMVRLCPKTLMPLES